MVNFFSVDQTTLYDKVILFCVMLLQESDRNISKPKVYKSIVSEGTSVDSPKQQAKQMGKTSSYLRVLITCPED